eukprot:2223378-Rhodomonas_salina.2
MIVRYVENLLLHHAAAQPNICQNAGSYHDSLELSKKSPTTLLYIQVPLNQSELEKTSRQQETDVRSRGGKVDGAGQGRIAFLSQQENTATFGTS